MATDSRIVDGIADAVDERGVARLRIERPTRMNALDGPASTRIIELCRAWAVDDSVCAVVLSGTGGSFCAGADVAGMAADAARSGGFDEQASRAIIENGSNLISAVRALPMPVIASLDGAAVGIGASLAVAADLVYATTRTYFLLPFVKLGLMPDGAATATFAASMGRARVNALALLGEKLWATEAFDAGLINAVVDEEAALDATVERAVTRIVATAPEALAQTKAALDAHSLAGYDAAIEREIAGQSVLLQTPHFLASVAAFAGDH